MRKSSLVIIILLVASFATNAQVSESQYSDPILSEVQRQAFIVLTDGEEFFASGIVMNQISLSIMKWRKSKNENWNDSARSILISEIARIEFDTPRKDHKHNGSHFWHRGWMWGGVMILMMLAMITGGVM